MSDEDKKTSLDTGTGGFEIAGRHYTYDVGNPDGDPAPKQPAFYDKKVVTNVEEDPETGKHKDLSKGTRLTLSRYISSISKGIEGSSGRKNYYTIDFNSELKEISTHDNGFPVGPTESINDSRFDKTPVGEQDNGLNPYSKNYPEIKKLINKGASNNNLQNGNDLLRGASGSISPINDYRTSVLRSNRFTEALRFDPLSRSEDSLLNLEKIKSIGVAVSMRASGEIVPSPFAPTDMSFAQLAAILPGYAQLGVWKPETSELETSVILEDTVDPLFKPTSELSISSRSWGAMNNVNDVYSGIDSLGMKLLSFALLLAVNIAIKAFLFLLQASPPSKEKIVKYDPLGSIAPLGKSYVERQESKSGFLEAALPILDFKKLAGIKSTRYTEYEDAVKKGMNIFFAMGEEEGSYKDSLKGYTNGFNVVFARAIIRSIYVFIESTALAVKSIIDNPLNAVNGILTIFELISRNKLFAIMNLFANIGDEATRIDAKRAEYNSQREIDGNITSRIDSIERSTGPHAMSPIYGNRKFNDSENGKKLTNKLTWATYTSPVFLPIRHSSLRLESQFDFAELEGMSVGFKNGYFQDDFDYFKEGVKSIEKSLDAAYVPFYFHDLRTDEVISFHAFLESITDGYSATYDSSEGIGRIEQVRNYKNTQRKFGFTFFIVSTGPDDVDSMYLKINKLVTMVYPQYTRGKEVVIDEKNKYIQPFSQLVGASPLIRVRLGDLATSNYSKFALGRLFGLFDGLIIDNDEEPSSTVTSQHDKDVKYYVDNPGEGEKLIGSSFGYVVDLSGTEDLITKINNLLSDEIKSKLSTYNESQVITDFKGKAYFSGFQGGEPVKLFFDIDNETQQILKELPKYVSPATQNKISEKVRQKSQSKAPSKAPSKTNTEKINDFLNSENNSIVKYFENNSGKGLAGYIESLDFTWDNYPWSIEGLDPNDEDHKYVRAPMMCKVQISFTPIHDITPGLDHFGVDRAPMYPVGYSRMTNMKKE